MKMKSVSSIRSFGASVLSLCLVASASVPIAAIAANGEMKKFRYQTCKHTICIVVQSEKGWLSAASGAFVASGSGQDTVTLQILENGKLKREFRGSEVVSQPEIHSMTIESDRSVVMVDVNDGQFDLIPKAIAGAGGGR